MALLRTLASAPNNPTELTHTTEDRREVGAQARAMVLWERPRHSLQTEPQLTAS